MKTKFDEKTSLPILTIEEKDLQIARDIKALIESKGWIALMESYAMAREEIIEKIKQLPKTEIEMRRTALIGAVLRGFDEAISIPSKIVLRAEEYIKNQEQDKQEDELNGAQDE